ncbi:hypothetical protein J27TS7_57540 [Paenibacillus dendritiformis]|uniref:hypothetical protein n=1 Tax=Paenibacillus dendritiformis TaxID=130049 RepID=UPI001B20ABB5|nr:hypothetical protein [Paenibacillus dendritiformis]GIO76240.1 hypothetical protein J27TS7_57540 [Paenibacillus dendritiformis]
MRAAKGKTGRKWRCEGELIRGDKSCKSAPIGNTTAAHNENPAKVQQFPLVTATIRFIALK